MVMRKGYLAYVYGNYLPYMYALSSDIMAKENPMPRAPSPQPKRRPVGRPPLSPEREADVRARVVQVALRLFRERGRQALNMRRIAQDAGLSTMNLYDYFPSKNEIIRAMWERFFTKCFNKVESAVHAAAASGAHRQIEVACDAYVNYWIEHPDEYRAVFMIEDRVEKQEHYFVDTSPIMARYLIFTELLMAHHGEAMTTAAEHPLRDRARALICGLNGICHMLITVQEYPWPPVPRLLDQLLRIVG